MRNLSSHVYDENEIKPLINKLQDYLAAFNALYTKLEDSLPAVLQKSGKDATLGPDSAANTTGTKYA